MTDPLSQYRSQLHHELGAVWAREDATATERYAAVALDVVGTKPRPHSYIEVPGLEAIGPLDEIKQRYYDTAIQHMSTSSSFDWLIALRCLPHYAWGQFHALNSREERRTTAEALSALSPVVARTQEPIASERVAGGGVSL